MTLPESRAHTAHNIRNGKEERHSLRLDVPSEALIESLNAIDDSFSVLGIGRVSL